MAEDPAGSGGDCAWHALDADAALERLRSDADRGLEEDEAARRSERYGCNRLTPPARRGAWARLLGQFNNLFIYLLLVAAAVTALLGEWVDSGVIFAVVLVIALIGHVQEGRAERALEAVRGMLGARARVMRAGRTRSIAAEALVPGDIVVLEAGDRVPADVRVLRPRNLQAQEAALTGESAAVAKHDVPVDADADLGDRRNMLYSGTVVTAGRGTALVVGIGDDTEIGRISGMLSGIGTLKTPLTRRLDGLARTLSIAIVLLATVTFGVGVLAWGRAWGEMFMAAVSIAVAAIPEGLPAVMTVTLAVGVQRMARRKAIIRRLPAVETLGSVTVVCSDKTGTLTRNEMTVRSLRTASRDIRVDGVGYAPDGGFRVAGGGGVLAEDELPGELVRAGLLCNDAHLRHDEGVWSPDGDPTEAALLVLARKAGCGSADEAGGWTRLDSIPFESERRYMATLDCDTGGCHVVHVKGAPERVLEMCSGELHDGRIEPLDAAAWQRRIDALAGRGERVLALARRELGEACEALDESQVESGLVLLGLVGLIDPPREEAIAAVAACQAAGIRVKMITGDHALTAQAVAVELGIANVDAVLTGRELEHEDVDALRRQAQGVDVFARTSPEHKLRLVEALQAGGAIVAMTGDGVNDAPALKRADIGIAMGRKGTDAAREAASMVLADDNFASIQRAIEEGRAVYDNLRKAILFILPTNVAQALVVVIAIVLGMTLPISPVQILWVNMITAVTLGMAFAWERPEGDVMRRPPREPREPLLTGFVLWRSGYVGVLLLLGAGGLFLYELARDPGALAFARTVAVNALVMGQIGYLWSARLFDAPSWTRAGLLGSRAVLVAVAVCVLFQLLFTHAPTMQRLFGSEALDAAAWLRCVAVGLAVFALVELEKWVRLRRRRLAGAAGAPR